MVHGSVSGFMDKALESTDPVRPSGRNTELPRGVGELTNRCLERPTPCTLHPAPYPLHPTLDNLHPTPYTLHPTPYTLHPAAADG